VSEQAHDAGVPEAAPAAAVPPDEAALPPIPPGWLTWRMRTLLVLGAVLVSGVVSGMIWHRVATPPIWTVLADGTAQATERGLSRVFAVDAWYVLIGLLFGMALGTLVWKLMSPLGWPVALVVCAAALLAGIVCWQMGRAFGPRDFVERLAAVGPAGGRVPADFDLGAKSALLVWPVGALLPVLLYPASELLVEWLGRRRRGVAHPEISDAS